MAYNLARTVRECLATGETAGLIELAHDVEDVALTYIVDAFNVE